MQLFGLIFLNISVLHVVGVHCPLFMVLYNRSLSTSTKQNVELVTKPSVKTFSHLSASTAKLEFHPTESSPSFESPALPSHSTS